MANYAQCALMALVYSNRDAHVVISGHSDGTFTWQAAFSHEMGAISHAELLQSFHALLGSEAPQAKVLVVVDGGVADYAKEGNVEVLKIDRDDDPDATVPSDWETLGKVFGIPTTPSPRPPEVILAKLVEALKHLDTPLLQEAKECLAKLPQ